MPIPDPQPGDQLHPDRPRDPDSDTDARLQIDNSDLGISVRNGATSTGGPAFDVFGGIVDGAGVYSFDNPSAVFKINLTGLDPAKRYTVALSTNRDQPTTGDERWTDLELLGVDSATEASGGTTTVLVPSTHVRFQSWDNTTRGDLARWTDIAPGLDGSFSVATTLYLAGDSDRSYVPVQLMLQETPAKLDQAALNVDAPTAGTYGSFYPMTASGGSGAGSVTWDVVAGSDACEIASGGAHDGELQITAGTGTCTIAATKAADATYNAATAQGTVTVAQADQTITFAALGDKYVNDPSFTVSATTDSGLAATFGAGGVCTANVDEVTLTGDIGTCTITASQPGDGNWNAATPVDQAFEVALAYAINGTVTAGGPGLEGAVVWVFDATSAAYVGNTATGSDGSFSINLAPGTYKLWIETNEAGYPDQLYGGTGNWETATEVDLTSTDQAPVIALVPTPVSHAINGTVTAGGPGLEGAVVWVFDATSAAYVGNTATGSDGSFSINLAPGTYKLWIETNEAGYPDQLYGGTGNWETATEVDLTSTDQAPVIALVPTPVSHAINGTVTAGGPGLEGAVVWVFDATSAAYVGNTATGSDGSFSINLAPGTYKLWIETNEAGYPDQLYGGTGNWETATEVDPTSTDQAPVIALVPTPVSHAINGTVTAGGPGLEARRSGSSMRPARPTSGTPPQDPTGPSASTSPRAPTSSGSRPTRRAIPTNSTAGPATGRRPPRSTSPAPIKPPSSLSSRHRRSGDRDAAAADVRRGRAGNIRFRRVRE